MSEIRGTIKRLNEIEEILSKLNSDEFKFKLLKGIEFDTKEISEIFSFLSKISTKINSTKENLQDEYLNLTTKEPKKVDWDKNGVWDFTRTVFRCEVQILKFDYCKDLYFECGEIFENEENLTNHILEHYKLSSNYQRCDNITVQRDSRYNCWDCLDHDKDLQTQEDWDTKLCKYCKEGQSFTEHRESIRKERLQDLLRECQRTGKFNLEAFKYLLGYDQMKYDPDICLLCKSPNPLEIIGICQECKDEIENGSDNHV